MWLILQFTKRMFEHSGGGAKCELYRLPTYESCSRPAERGDGVPGNMPLLVTERNRGGEEDDPVFSSLILNTVRWQYV